MGLYISDGKGRGNTAGVSNDNQLMTLATTKSLEHYVNTNFGDAYASVLTVTPSVNGACVLYFKNNNELDLIIEQIEVFTAADQILSMYLNVEGTPSGGITTIPSNVNASSAKLADGVFLEGSNINGLSGGRLVSKLKAIANEQSRVWNFPADLVVGKIEHLQFFVLHKQLKQT